MQSFRHGSRDQACLTHSQAFLTGARRCGPVRHVSLLRRAAHQDANGADTSGDFNLAEYIEAKVERGLEPFEAVSPISQNLCCSLPLPCSREDRQ